MGQIALEPKWLRALPRQGPRGKPTPPHSPNKQVGQGRNASGGRAVQDGSPLDYDPNDRGGQASSTLLRAHPNLISPGLQAVTAHAPQLDLTTEGKWAEDLVPAVAWVALQTHRPHCCGWTGVVRQARTKNLHRLRLRRGHASLSQGPRPCATIWHASSPSLSPHNHALSNHSTSPPSVKVICTDLDHAITT